MMEDALDQMISSWLVQAIGGFLTPGTLAIVLLVALVLAAVLGLTVALAARAFARHPSVRRALLFARVQYAEPGPRAEVLNLRLNVQEELASARRAVESALDCGALTAHLPDLLKRLQVSAARLDTHLQVLEQAGDLSPEDLRSARERTGQVLRVARDLRSAASAALGATSRDELDRLAGEVDRNVLWVQDGVEALEQLGRPGVDPVRIPAGR